MRDCVDLASLPPPDWAARPVGKKPTHRASSQLAATKQARQYDMADFLEQTQQEEPAEEVKRPLLGRQCRHGAHLEYTRWREPGRELFPLASRVQSHISNGPGSARCRIRQSSPEFLSGGGGGIKYRSRDDARNR